MQPPQSATKAIVVPPLLESITYHPLEEVEDEEECPPPKKQTKGPARVLLSLRSSRSVIPRHLRGPTCVSVPPKSLSDETPEI